MVVKSAVVQIDTGIGCNRQSVTVFSSSAVRTVPNVPPVVKINSFINLSRKKQAAAKN